jgi:hypothetical protein
MSVENKIAAGTWFAVFFNSYLTATQGKHLDRQHHSIGTIKCSEIKGKK